jgi:hypothetical protein
LEKLQSAYANELLVFQQSLQGKEFCESNKQEYIQKISQQGHLSVHDNFFADKNERQAKSICLDSAISKYLQFSLEPGQLFERKERDSDEELKDFQKAVKQDFMAQNQKLEDLIKEQQSSKDSLQTILSLLRNP